jgi:hypothetical protein
MVMSEFNLPSALVTLSKELNLEITVRNPLSEGNTKGIWFETINIMKVKDKENIEVRAELVLNSEITNEFELTEVVYKNCHYLDEPTDQLCEVVGSIFRGNVREEKTFFRKKNRVVILDDNGREIMRPYSID